ncbi:DUF397 domain-containing protein [Saccharopolyspora sp. SCSIO 74807]|uniref:DUF397 domain-containing protein n=1 Tax=Saccharopolyspora sp. SCSIO 74807 TaxID=3118084 RepID=UPI0030D5887D
MLAGTRDAPSRFPDSAISDLRRGYHDSRFQRAGAARPRLRSPRAPPRGNRRGESIMSGWHKSSRSGANSGCVEVGGFADTAAIRDTKNRSAGQLSVPKPQWCAFLAALKRGRFDGSGQSTSLPGFRMPVGSTARFAAPSTAVPTGPTSDSSHGR